jgi:hypothetical protein
VPVSSAFVTDVLQAHSALVELPVFKLPAWVPHPSGTQGPFLLPLGFDALLLSEQSLQWRVAGVACVGHSVLKAS